MDDYSNVVKTIATVRIRSGTRLGKILSVRLGPDGEKIYSVRTRSRPRQAWSRTVHEVPVSAFLGDDPGWEV